MSDSDSEGVVGVRKCECFKYHDEVHSSVFEPPLRVFARLHTKRLDQTKQEFHTTINNIQIQYKVQQIRQMSPEIKDRNGNA